VGVQLGLPREQISKTLVLVQVPARRGTPSFLTMSTVSRELQLLICVGGIYLFYLLFGYYQEDMYVNGGFFSSFFTSSFILIVIIQHEH
jgi:hypothetical protein